MPHQKVLSILWNDHTIRVNMSTDASSKGVVYFIIDLPQYRDVGWFDEWITASALASTAGRLWLISVCERVSEVWKMCLSVVACGWYFSIPAHILLTTWLLHHTTSWWTYQYFSDVCCKKCCRAVTSHTFNTVLTLSRHMSIFSLSEKHPKLKM